MYYIRTYFIRTMFCSSVVRLKTHYRLILTKFALISTMFWGTQNSFWGCDSKQLYQQTFDDRKRASVCLQVTGRLHITGFAPS